LPLLIDEEPVLEYEPAVFLMSALRICPVEIFLETLQLIAYLETFSIDFLHIPEYDDLDARLYHLLDIPVVNARWRRLFPKQGGLNTKRRVDRDRGLYRT
jgi:hypothetical protein